MRKGYVLISFLVAAASYGQPQYPGQPYFGTPAQWDLWERAADNADNFVAGRGSMDRPSGESVSVARLRHVLPRGARAAFLRGIKDAGTGATRQSLQEFQRAVAIDPDFAEAHCNLGVEYAALGLLDESAAALRRSIELDPATGIPHANLAYVLIRLNRDDEAEREAQTAVSLEPSYANGQFLLGYVLSRRPETHRLAAVHLTDAARQLPEAHYLLAKMYFEDGNNRIAGEELDRFRKAIQSKAKTALQEAGSLSAK